MQLGSPTEANLMLHETGDAPGEHGVQSPDQRSS